MPPKETKRARESVHKNKAAREPESVSSEHEQEAEVAPEEEYDSDEDQPSRTQRTPLKSKLEEAIADFYQANPLFYDKGNPDYKNKDKKRALLEIFCKMLGMGTERKFCLYLE